MAGNSGASAGPGLAFLAGGLPVVAAATGPYIYASDSAPALAQ